MEVAASGIAVASIAIQLLNSTNTISTFIRCVKDASQELLQIAGRLDRLGGILQVVVDVLDQQASLQDELIPVPDSITRCLQRCEQTLAPLQEVVNKSSKIQASSRLRRLQADVRAALKAGEVRSLEDRLQQEIDILSLALIANGTRIQLHMYTVLLPKQSASLKNPPPAAQELRISHGSEAGLGLNHRQNVSSSIATSFHALHIRNIRSKRILSGDLSSGRRDRSGNGFKLTEENEYFVSLPFVRWGIFMSQQTRFGPIFPALRVYPIIDDMDSLYDKVNTWTIQSFQMDVCYGKIHPFTRDRNHHSLLHLAAERRRPDLYSLLLDYGVKSDHGKRGSVWDSISHCEVVDNTSKPYELLTIDTYRLLWADYEGNPRALRYIRQGGPWGTRELRWSSVEIWPFEQSPTQLCGSELTDFQHAVMRGMFLNFIRETNLEGLRWLDKVPHTAARILLAEEIRNGTFGLLKTFFTDLRLFQPQTIGATIISALSLLDIDIEGCIMQELLQFPLGVIESNGCRLGKKITFSKQSPSRYTLDWVWVFDRLAPGYLLLAELLSLTVDSDFNLPCHGDRFPANLYGPLFANRHDRAKLCLMDTEIEKWPQRFEFRRAKKERKDLARSKQKPTRPKMPGSWVF